jgi:hypothetical protein
VKSKTKNWYCTSCVCQAGWMDEKREYMNASLDWLCNPECRARAVAYREEVERQPRPQPAAAAVASSSSNAPAGASSSSNALAGASSSGSRAWVIDPVLLQALGPATTPPTMLQANPSEHFGNVSPKFMCPVEPNMLDSLFPVGKNLLQRHGAAQVEELVVRRPPLTAVRRRGGDLRGIKRHGEHQARARPVTHANDDATIQPGDDQVTFVVPAAPEAVAEDDDAEDQEDQEDQEDEDAQ